MAAQVTSAEAQRQQRQEQIAIALVGLSILAASWIA